MVLLDVWVSSVLAPIRTDAFPATNVKNPVIWEFLFKAWWRRRARLKLPTVSAAVAACRHAPEELFR